MAILQSTGIVISLPLMRNTIAGALNDSKNISGIQKKSGSFGSLLSSTAKRTSSSSSSGNLSSLKHLLSRVSIRILVLLMYLIYLINNVMFIHNKYKVWYDNIIISAQSRDLLGYYEIHHVLPKSLGGTNCSNNLVKLTAREHFICHLLLTKFTTGKAKSQMYFALNMLRVSNKYQDRYVTARVYEKLKKTLSKELSSLHKGKTVSAQTRALMSEKRTGKESPFKNKTHTNEVKEILSNKNKGHTRNNKDVVEKITNSRSWYTHSEITKAKISAANKGKHDGPRSEDTKSKISSSLRGRKKPKDFGDKISKARTGLVHSNDTKQLMSKRAKDRTKISCSQCNKVVSPGNYKRWHGDNCKFKTL
jgi:hypothetical protein